MYQQFRSSIDRFATSLGKTWRKRRRNMSRVRIRRDFMSLESLESRALMAAGQDLVAFAKALTASGAKFYGAGWCPDCNQQKAAFGDGAQFLPFVEVTNGDGSFNQIGIDNQIDKMPTWILNDAARTKLFGVQAPEVLSAATGIAIPTSEVPTFAALDHDNAPIVAGGTVKVGVGSPFWVPLDGFDPQDDALTYTVTSSNSDIIATLGGSQKSAKISVQDFGDMVFHLFDDLVQRPTGRFEQLATDGFYNKTGTQQTIFHRVIKDFVLQAGDPVNGNGTGGSGEGNFDDQFNLDLQHNRRGVLSYAKTSDDDTNDSQFFITAGDTRGLDFNHSVFGTLVEGESVRAAIARMQTNASDKPITDIVINSVNVFNDAENGIVLLKAKDGVTSGTSNITITVSDGNGHTSSLTFVAQIGADTYLANGATADANTSPFLSDIPAQNVPAGTTQSFQLIGNDAEKNTLSYSAEKVTGAPAGATVSVNSTGLVSVSAPAGFAGSFQIQVSVTQTPAGISNGNRDTQLVTVNVSPAAPSTPVLTTASDSGISNADGITNDSTLEFTVNGVTSGAQVRLFSGTTQLAQKDATGTSVTFSIDANAVALPLGPNSITAVQVTGGVVGASSEPLQIVYDPLILDTTPAPPTTAEGNVPFTFDPSNPEEGQSGFRYSLLTPPTGMTIDTTTGVINWTPTSAQVGQRTFTLRAEDAAGNQKDVVFNINVARTRLAQASFVLLDLNGNVITSIKKGQEFFLVGNVRDLRPDATGVSAFFADVTYDATLASVVGTIDHGTTYTANTSGTTTTAGLLDEVGGSTTVNAGGQSAEFFRVRMKALKTGTLAIASDIADSHNVVANTAPSSGSQTSLGNDDLVFGTATLAINPPFTLQEEEFNVNEDSANSTLDVLRNVDKPTGDVLTIVSLGTPSAGGMATITSDGKVSYKPKANFFGDETFTYTVRNQDGDEGTQTVTVTVTNINDTPVAIDDGFSVNEDSAEAPFDILQNDLANNIDPTEVFTIKSVNAGDNGGTLIIDATNKLVRYTPKANFFGNETFTYVVRDAGGLESTGTIVFNVKEINDNPIAVADNSPLIPQNSVDQKIDVLVNDTPGNDAGVTPVEVITITAKTDGANGTVKIAADGKSVLYTPKTGFRGSDTFTYTISDGRGGTSTGTVKVNVATSNSPPTAVPDTITTRKNIVGSVNVLANDSFAPDTGETLTLQSITQPANGTARVEAGGVVVYSPKDGFTGTDTFTYTVADDLGATATTTVTVTVVAVAPSEISGMVYMDLNNNGRMDVNEPGIAGVVVALSGTDQDKATVTQNATTDSSGRYVFSNINPGDYKVTETQPDFLIDGGSNSLSFKIATEGSTSGGHDFGELGRRAQFIKLSELFGSTSRSRVMVSVGSSAQTWSQLSGGWEDYKSVNVSLSSDRSNVTVTATDASDKKYKATVPVSDSKRVRLLGNEGTKDLVQLLGSPTNYALLAVGNTAPSFTKGADQSVAEDSTKKTVTNWATALKSGVDGEATQTLSFVVTTNNDSLFTDKPAISSTGELTFTPAANAFGEATVTVVLKDNGGTSDGGVDSSAAQTFKITINSVNDTPSFTKGANQSVAEDSGAQSVTNWATAISAGPANESAQILTFEIADNSLPSLFTVAPAIDASGKLTYTPAANTTGVATIKVRAKDSGGTAQGAIDVSGTQEFTITVTGTNDPPVAVNDSATTTEEAAVTINVLANDTEPESDTLSVSRIITQPANGNAVVNSNGTITYTPNANFSGTSTFVYELSDGKGGLASATVTVTVTGVNDAPTATDDAQSTQEDTTKDFDVLANDNDPDGNALTLTITGTPISGTATVVDGKIRYVPEANFTGDVEIEYKITDPSGLNDQATLTVTIDAVNDAPDLTVPDDQITFNDQALTFSSADANDIQLEDIDAGTSDMLMTVSVVGGKVTLNQTTGLSFTQGDGTDDASLSFTGTLAEIQAALNGLIYSPDSAFSGSGSISFTVSDQGNTGTGGSKQVSGTINIDVSDPNAESFESNVDDFMSQL